MSEFKEGVLRYSGVDCRYAEAGQGTNVVIFPDGGVTPIDDIAMALAAHHRVLVLDTTAVTRGEQRTFATNLTFALANVGVEAFSVGCRAGRHSRTCPGHLYTGANSGAYPRLSPARLGAER